MQNYPDNFCYFFVICYASDLKGVFCKLGFRDFFTYWYGILISMLCSKCRKTTNYSKQGHNNVLCCGNSDQFKLTTESSVVFDLIIIYKPVSICTLNPLICHKCGVVGPLLFL